MNNPKTNTEQSSSRCRDFKYQIPLKWYFQPIRDHVSCFYDFVRIGYLFLHSSEIILLLRPWTIRQVRSNNFFDARPSVVIFYARPSGVIFSSWSNETNIYAESSEANFSAEPRRARFSTRSSRTNIYAEPSGFATMHIPHWRWRWKLYRVHITPRNIYILMEQTNTAIR